MRRVSSFALQALFLYSTLLSSYLKEVLGMTVVFFTVLAAAAFIAGAQLLRPRMAQPVRVELRRAEKIRK
jgi:membrane-bound metal-dependent hydrolase YbcI (DUF457 family)